MTTGRYGHGAVACQGSAFIIGGTNGSDDLDSLEKYDHFNNIWERIRPFAHLRFRLIVLMRRRRGESSLVDRNGSFD